MAVEGQADMSGAQASDEAWLAELPADAEWLTPPGWQGRRGGLRCRLCPPESADDPPPPPGWVGLEFWAGGWCSVPVAELRTWGRFHR